MLWPLSRAQKLTQQSFVAFSRKVIRFSAMGIHVPACCGQWTAEEASRHFEDCAGRLLVNYVDYEFSPRSGLLRRLKAEMPEANVLLMEPGDRTRYFDMSRAERFREWAGHKSTLILPVGSDLSTRVFDALLAGQILLVPEGIVDFDEVMLWRLLQN